MKFKFYTIILIALVMQLILVSLGCSKSSQTYSQDVIIDFNYTLYEGTLLLQNTTSGELDGDITWLWDFGDGTTSIQESPVHEYEKDGQYRISLNIEGYNIHPNVAGKSEVLNVNLFDDYMHFTDERDGETYKYVQIGDQFWMAENLRYNSAESLIYENDTSLLRIFGRLYRWQAALSSCPEGWHLPSDSEWKQLEVFLGMSPEEIDLMSDRGTTQGTSLKSSAGWENNGNGTNTYGFTVLPSGLSGACGFCFLNSKARFWTSSTYSGSGKSWAYTREFGSHFSGISRIGVLHDYQFDLCVRCIMD